MATWYPGAMSYWKWVQAESYKDDITSTIKEQTNEIVANQQQTRQAISSRLDRIAAINYAGFENVTNAIEGLHSMLSYKLGLILQELEIQSGLLRDILHTLRNPLKTQVEEFYNDGCRLVRESILDKAIQKFNKVLNDLDDTHFLTHYQLGLLYLNGKTNDENVIDLKKANEHLITACRLGKGKAKTDSSFNPAVANAMFFTSLSFYFQLNNETDPLLDNAIKYAEEAIVYNPNLSQSYYHLGKYYSLSNQIEKMKLRLEKAIEIDRMYALDVNDEKTFDKNRNHVNLLLTKLRDQKAVISDSKLQVAKQLLNSLTVFDVQNTIYEDDIINYKQQLETATKFHNCKTYFGYLDSIPISESLNNTGNQLLSDLQLHVKTLKSEKSKGVLMSIWGAIWGPVIGGICGLCLGLIIGIPGCFVVAIKRDSGGAGERFLDNTSSICIFGGIIIGFIVGIAMGPSGYKSYVASKRKNK